MTKGKHFASHRFPVVRQSGYANTHSLLLDHVHLHESLLSLYLEIHIRKAFTFLSDQVFGAVAGEFCYDLDVVN